MRSRVDLGFVGSNDYIRETSPDNIYNDFKITDDCKIKGLQFITDEKILI